MRRTTPPYPRGASRRRLLAGIAGLAGLAGAAGGVTGLAGCDRDPPANGTSPPQLTGFLASSVALADRYDAVLTAVPALSASLGPVRDAHRAHARAVADATAANVPASGAVTAVPAGRAEALTYLLTAEKAARDEAITACLASTPRLASLLGSIAAARASHLEVLK